MPEHRIPPPREDREPLKRNLFDFLRSANTTLVPLFPYFERGDIVVAGTLFENGPDVRFGFFEHRNDVDEVFVCFASESSRIPPGSVRVGNRKHYVGTPFKDNAAPDGFALVAIVQRQTEEGHQEEEVIFPCVKCHAPLLVRVFDATPPEPGTQEQALGPHAPFPTLVESLRTYEAFNASDRTCAACGTVNPPFPTSQWGVDAYVDRSGTVRRALQQHTRLSRGEGRR